MIPRFLHTDSPWGIGPDAVAPICGDCQQVLGIREAADDTEAGQCPRCRMEYAWVADLRQNYYNPDYALLRTLRESVTFRQYSWDRRLIDLIWKRFTKQGSIELSEAIEDNLRAFAWRYQKQLEFAKFQVPKSWAAAPETPSAERQELIKELEAKP